MEKPCMDCPRFVPGYEKCSGNCAKYLDWFRMFWPVFTAKLRREWGSTGQGNRPIKTNATVHKKQEQGRRVVTYRVFLAESGKLVAQGQAGACARAMGMSRESFHSVVSKTRHGLSHKWRVETRENVR